MKLFRHTFIFGSVVPALPLVAASARSDVIRLEKDCGGTTPPACFEDDLAGVLDELHDPTPPRQFPGPGNPVVVAIGIGTFTLSSTANDYCNGLSDVSFRGAGMEVTTLTGGGFGGITDAEVLFDLWSPYTVRIQNCARLSFENLRIENDASSSGTIRFAGEGSTRWTNVIIHVNPNGLSSAWLDSGSSSVDASTHHWHNAGITIEMDGNANYGFMPSRSTQRIDASSIVVRSTDTVATINYGAIFCVGPCRVRASGVRIEVDDPGSDSESVNVQIHGAGIGLPSCIGADVQIGGAVFVHRAFKSAGVLRNDCNGNSLLSVRGADYRIEAIPRGATPSPVPPRRVTSHLGAAGIARIDAPHALGTGANPPDDVTASWSGLGQDTFIETDCSTVRCADTEQGSESHLLTFDPSCAIAGPWFDTQAGACRGA